MASDSNKADDNKKTNEEEEEWKVQRDQCKLLGDEAFKVRDYATAIENYSQALSLDPDNHILLSNRSAAYLSTQQKSKALYDAQKCVEVMPSSFVKGYSRLGAALQSLGRYDNAIETWEKLLSKDENNVAAKKGLEDSRRLQEESRKRNDISKDEDMNEDAADSSKKTTTATAETSNDDIGDDLLDDFFNEVETATAKVKAVVREEAAEEENEAAKPTHAIAHHKKDLKNADYQIDRLLQENYKWRNLNPFYVLDLPHTATKDDISRRYKALGLLLHPDKNRNNPRAEAAYDEVQKAKAKLDDEDKANHCRQLAENGMKQGKYDWNNLADKTGETLESMQSKAIHKIFAQIEYKRREVERRNRSHEQRERQQEQEELDKEKKQRDFEKKWKQEERVDKRIGNWRDFAKNKKTKKT